MFKIIEASWSYEEPPWGRNTESQRRDNKVTGRCDMESDWAQERNWRKGQKHFRNKNSSKEKKIRKAENMK